MIAVALLARQNPLRLPRRALAALFLMGGLGYAGQSFSFFFALRTLPASLVALVLYTYPALVAIAGVVLYRRRIPPVQVLALVGSFLGVALLVGGVPIALGSGLPFLVAAPLIYTGYILAGERVMPGLPALAASAVTLTGAAFTWTVAAAVTGHLRLPASHSAWALVASIALIPTMVAVTAFLAALPRIGGSRAALLSTFEPVVTVALAVALLGDRFGALQLLGGLLILASVARLQWPGREIPVIPER